MLGPEANLDTDSPIVIPETTRQYWGAHVDQGSIYIDQTEVGKYALPAENRYLRYRLGVKLTHSKEFSFYDLLESETTIKGFRSNDPKRPSWVVQDDRGKALIRTVRPGIIMKNAHAELASHFDDPRDEFELYQQMKALRLQERYAVIPEELSAAYVAGAIECGIHKPESDRYALNLRSYPLVEKISLQFGGTAFNLENNRTQIAKDFKAGRLVIHRDEVQEINRALVPYFRTRFVNGLPALI